MKELIKLKEMDPVFNFYHENEIETKATSTIKLNDSNKVVFLGDLDANYDFEEVFESSIVVVTDLLGDQMKEDKLFDRNDEQFIFEEKPQKGELECL